MIIISCVVPMPISVEENLSLYIEETGTRTTDMPNMQGLHKGLITSSFLNSGKVAPHSPVNQIINESVLDKYDN